MFMSVDLPAPFSPRSACTSPPRRSKSMASLARTPGNDLVTLRSSSTVAVGTALSMSDDCSGRASRPAPNVAPFLDAAEGCGHLDRAGDDLRLERVHLRDERLRYRRVDLADAHAVVLEREQQVGPAERLSFLRGLHREEDAGVDPLNPAREDMLG